jgi:cell division GTPase FtsZ
VNDNFDVEVPDIPLPPENQADQSVNDEVDGAFKFCFIGSGQGGGRIASSFYGLGYRRVCVINSTVQDLSTVNIPEKLKLCIGDGGAGKNPSVAAELLSKKKEEVFDFMRSSFGPAFDRIVVCVGAGGGTGAGTALGLVDIAAELQRSARCQSEKVGMILALPKVSEGTRVNANAYEVLSEVLALVESGKVSPLVIVDNEKISSIYPGLAVDPFWATANGSICSLFHLFNNICTKQSTYSTFDKADFGSLVDSGIIVFGASPARHDSQFSITSAVRDNLKKNVLAGGVDLSSGKSAGVVVIGGQEILGSVPTEWLDSAFEQFTRMLAPGSVVHRGIYRGNKPSLTVYTLIGGLGRPVDRLADLRRAGLVQVSVKPSARQGF